MKLLIEKNENFTTITLDIARFDASIAADFKHQVEDAIDKNGDQIILDISKLKFMDSSSLGATVAVLKKIGNGKLVICGASGVVLDLFRLTRMDKVFTLRNTLEDSQQLFKSTCYT